MSSSYDEWKATTPEDEKDAAEEREKRRNAAAQRKAERDEFFDPHGRWADYVYDPLSRKGFE